MKSLKVIGIVVLAVMIGVGVGWYLSQRGDVAPIAIPASALAANNAPIKLAPPPTNIDSITNDTAASGPGDDTSTNAAPAEEHKSVDEKLDDILLSADDPATKASNILALIPNAPPEKQVELSQHLVNMVQDDNYAGTAQLLTNSSTSAEVGTVLMNDLLNRNNNLKLPMLLTIAENDDHPLHGQAKEMLELLIQDDKGTNWDDWQTAINTWLTNNAQ